MKAFFNRKHRVSDQQLDSFGNLMALKERLRGLNYRRI